MSLVEKILRQHYPYLCDRWFSRPLLKFLRSLLRERDVQELFDSLPAGNAYDYIDEILHRFNFSYQVKSHERSNIPDIGPVIVVANHPIGSLDCLALVQMMHQLRADVKVITTDLLRDLTPLDPLMIPMDYETGSLDALSRAQLSGFMRHGLLIIFPAREVSRLRHRDKYWQTDFLEIARKFRVPVLPVHIQAKNSMLFYVASGLSKRLSRLMLVRETWKMRGQSIRMTVGRLVDYDTYQSTGLDLPDLTAVFRRHLFRIARSRPGLFVVRTGIAPPRPRELMAGEIRDHCEHLADVPNGFSVHLCTDMRRLNLLHDLGRCREHSFRYSGQGSGRRLDIDSYDDYYHHLLLWHEDTRSIAGAYRLLPCAQSLENPDKPMYISSLFRFQPDAWQHLSNSVEFGRSFVQPRFWGSRALEYLWAGIALYLGRLEKVGYLVGSVSFSAGHNKTLGSLLIQHYSYYYRPPFHPHKLIEHVNSVSETDTNSLLEIAPDLPTGDENADMRRIRRVYADAGLTVPALFRHYAGLCEKGGASFFAFGRDSSFSDCFECFLMVDFSKALPNKVAYYQSLTSRD
ncbi:MAG: lysophospholipid acyltransferase family protein [Gammaproteobacteria bacterium]|nr:lysophospholipid acyltransferase family protein [Pseudomonadota bacterium]MCH9663877.1 lysophospholipid acyltransferase family protein [Gammaproteobacteria bacterium]